MEQYIKKSEILEAVEKSMKKNPHESPERRIMHVHEHRHFLAMIMWWPESDAVTLSKEEYAELLEYKHKYEGLQK